MKPPDESSFPDHFSAVAAGYAAHRPRYPAALVDHLAILAPRRETAWDCGCGSGQLSVDLARCFERVMATDASQEQIAAGRRHARVEYRCAPAEASGLAERSVDLAVAAQAAHWFDLEGYYAEVRRVARPDAAVALVAYGNPEIEGAVGQLVERFYGEVAGPYWPPERVLIETGYRTLAFPFEEIEAPPMELRESWRAAEFLGYVETWSALRGLEKAQGRAPIEAFRAELERAWGPEERVRRVHWPLSLRIGRT